MTRAALVFFAVVTAPSVVRAQAAPKAAPAAPTGEDTPDRGRFGALWLTPVATHWFQGAGVEAGYRYRWLAGLYRVGFFQNGNEPVDGGPLLAFERTRRFLLDLELDGQVTLAGRVAVALGGGVGLVDDHVTIASMNGPTWTTATDSRFRARPLVGATLAGPLFELNGAAYLDSDPEVRLSLGVQWGRPSRRR